MNKGIEILLERMKSNPEEFVHPTNNLYAQSKWGSLVAEYGESLDAEDIEAYKKAVKELRQEKFTEAVMKELLDPKSESNPYLVQSATGLGGATQGLSSIQNQALNNLTLGTNANGQLAWQPNTATLTLGQTQLQEEQVKHMIAHLDWLKREEQLKKQKKHKTLFGRLFNYQ